MKQISVKVLNRFITVACFSVFLKLNWIASRSSIASSAARLKKESSGKQKFIL